MKRIYKSEMLLLSLCLVILMIPIPSHGQDKSIQKRWNVMSVDPFPSTSLFTEAQALERMRKNLRNKITLGSNYDTSNSAVKSKINSIGSNAQTYWNNMVKSPTTYLWSDYNKLKNNASNTPTHIYYSYLRLLTMAQAYAYQTSSLNGNSHLLKDIINGLAFLNDYAYNASTQRVGNFWEWHIGIPDAYARIISILYDSLPLATITNYANAVGGQVRYFVANGNYTFANQADICKSLFFCGVLSGNMKDVQYAMDNLVRVFVDETTLDQRKAAQASFESLWKAQGDYHAYSVTKKEGLYPDGTFIQHIAIPYIGTYGIEIISASAQIQSILEGTQIQLPDGIRNNLSTWINKAYLPAIYKGEMMMMFMGRGVKRNPNDIARSLALDIAESAVSIADATEQVNVLNACRNIFTQNTFYSDVYSGIDPIIDKPRLDKLMELTNSSSREDESFNLVFSSGDRVIHQRPGFRFGISMSSSRIGKFETLNKENIYGWYLGDGMTYLYNDDRAQFVNYFSTIDPKRLPGTTVDAIARAATTTSNYGLFGIPTNAKDWVGGTSLMGQYGTAGMYLVGQVSSLEAKKSWFMFDNEIVALGSGITLQESRRVETIVENRKSSNVLSVDGVAKPQARGWSEVLSNVSWIQLDGTSGYYFPGNPTINAYRDYNGYIQLYFDHGTTPLNATYAYVLLPGETAERTAAYASCPEVQILSNTKKIQAAKDVPLGVTGINFWEAGNLDFVSSKSAASLMYQRTGDLLNLSVSDPTWKQSQQQLVLQGTYSLVSSSTGRVSVSSVGNITTLTINSQDMMGMSHQIVLRDQKPTSILQAENIDKPRLTWDGRANLTIVNLPATGAKVMVYDASGKNVMVANNVGRSLSVNLSKYGKGIFFIQCVIEQPALQTKWKIVLN